MQSKAALHCRSFKCICGEVPLYRHEDDTLHFVDPLHDPPRIFVMPLKDPSAARTIELQDNVSVVGFPKSSQGYTAAYYQGIASVSASGDIRVLKEIFPASERHLNASMMGLWMPKVGSGLVRLIFLPWLEEFPRITSPLAGCSDLTLTARSLSMSLAYFVPMGLAGLQTTPRCIITIPWEGSCINMTLTSNVERCRIASSSLISAQ